MTRMRKWLTGLGAALAVAALTWALPAPHNGALAFSTSAQANVRLLMPVTKKPMGKEFALKDLQGKTWRLSDLRGKVVVINFWATSCPVCRVEMPSLQSLWRSLRKVGVQVLTIHKGGTIGEIRAFAEKYALQLPILHDADGSVSNAWGALRLPLTMVLDQQGRVAFMAFGGRNWRNPQIARIIMTLLPPL